MQQTVVNRVELSINYCSPNQAVLTVKNPNKAMKFVAKFCNFWSQIWRDRTVEKSPEKVVRMSRSQAVAHDCCSRSNASAVEH